MTRVLRSEKVSTPVAMPQSRLCRPNCEADWRRPV